MGPHHQNKHGKVLRGLEAQGKLKHLKRDSAHINMNDVPDSSKSSDTSNNSGGDGGVQTIVSVVYQTVSADFTGATAGYVTVTPSTASLYSTVPSASSAVLTTSVAAVSPTTDGQSSSSSSIPTASSSIPEDGSNNKLMFLNPPATAVAAFSSTAATATASSASGGISNHSDGLSGGAKAGIAIGVLCGLALIAGLLFYCYRRKKNPNPSGGHSEIVNEKRTSAASSFFGGKALSEKHASIAGETTSTHAASTAPRLSLRPVTQFLPSMADNRKSSGTTHDVAAAMSEKPKSMWERRSNNNENPFADASVVSDKDACAVTPSTNPFDEPEGKPEGRQASPETSSAKAAVTGAAPAAAKAANNVHRVQLDFKPSMDDELELKSGQLVRVLHEYDDGWALCIRMDRTQQGVAPRTCLSKLPVKPRPQGPPAPGAQNARPITPSGPPGMMPRPLTPTSRERSGSNASAEAPASVPARKPVPGQAL